MTSLSAASCLFCKIVKNEIPASIVYENAKTIAFMDIFPLSKGHVLIVPKFHAQKLHQLPDQNLSDLLVVTKKIVQAAIESNICDNYNILQNNGEIAHQEIEHVHFHLIPKPNEEQGLGLTWKCISMDKNELETLAQSLKENIKE